MNCCSIWAPFGLHLGTKRGPFGLLWAPFGVIWGCMWQPFGQGGSGRGPGSDLEGILAHFDSILERFGSDVGAILATMVVAFDQKRSKVKSAS